MIKSKRFSRIIAVLVSVITIFTTIPKSYICNLNTNAISVAIEQAITWAINTANDQTHGYSQENRNGPDYDCSSFVYYSLKSAGLCSNLKSAFNTESMKSQLPNCGFTYISWNSLGGAVNLQRGDILWYRYGTHGHTEIYIGDNQLVGAHGQNPSSKHPNRSPKTGDQGDEISVLSYYNDSQNPWMGIFRYGNFNEAPNGVLDSYGSDGRNVYVRGWCFDNDDISAKLGVHIYLKDNAGEMYGVGGLTADSSRPDVNSVYGCGDNHGFEGSLSVENISEGEYTVMVAFLDSEEGGANAKWCEGGKIFVQHDYDAPSISDVKILDISKDGYSVQCKVTDNEGISKVQFPTWTENNGQDDIQADWGNNPAASGTIEGDTVIYRVNISDHYNERGIYNTHIYAFDLSGNSTAIGVAICIEDIAPEISDVKYYDVSSSGYTIECTVIDEGGSGLNRVQFPTWTENNGQDDIYPDWVYSVSSSGIIEGNKVTYRVNTVDHNNELGIYNTHIYAYDNDGNVSCFGIALVLEDIAPEISNVRYYDVSSSGYTVECTVVDEGGSGLDRVQFPTWTENNGQDDIQLDWVYGESASGTIDGNKATYRVNTADHNNEFGEYVTHIYAWDKSGNYTCFGLGSIIISSGIIGDSNNDGEVNVADLVMLQRWLLTESNELTCWQNVDLCEDGVIDTFDMVMLRRLLIEKGITK